MLRWLRFPMAITLPGGRRHERHAYLFWRVRLPLWLVPVVAGWLVLSWPGIAPGLAAGILAELPFSYRAPYGPAGRCPPRGRAGVQTNLLACVSLAGRIQPEAPGQRSIPPTQPGPGWTDVRSVCGQARTVPAPRLSRSALRTASAGCPSPGAGSSSVPETGQGIPRSFERCRSANCAVKTQGAIRAHGACYMGQIDARPRCDADHDANDVAALPLACCFMSVAQPAKRCESTDFVIRYVLHWPTWM